MAKKATTTRKSASAREVTEAQAYVPPARFEDIIGQDRAMGILHGALTSARVHHAWLFAGPSGVGKRMAARAWGALLLDPTTKAAVGRPPTFDASGPTRTLLAAGSHPDFHEVSKESAVYSSDKSVRDSKQRTLSIDVLREFVIAPAELTATLPAGPGALASKVFIIDEAEFAADAGQNALLKTLEEPPTGTILILVSGAPHRLLPTIRSRCQMLTFAPLSTEAMDRWLAGQSIDLPRDSVAAVKAIADGSPGEALRAIRTGVLEWFSILGGLLDEVIAGRYSPSLAASMAKCIDDWATARVEENRDASKEAARHAASHLMLRVIASLVRERLAHAAKARPDAAQRHADHLERLDVAQRQIDANVQPIFALENWIVGAVRGT